MLDMDFQRQALEEAHETLGAVLQERRSPFELVQCLADLGVEVLNDDFQ
jgi:hypothetical protein